MTVPSDLDATYRSERSRLRALVYRMTGAPQDADDIVQEAFTRAITRPPADTSQPWGPWLTRVAVNLAIDALRARQRRSYVGAWLPVPVPCTNTAPDDRLGDLEQVSYAFLCAAEALGPKQRAVLILRDALEYSSREVAELLDVTDADVRTSLTRARKIMAAAPTTESIDPARHAAHLAAIQAFLGALTRRDMSALTTMLTADVHTSSDGAGRYRAALNVVRGREAVAKLWLGLGGRTPPMRRTDVLTLNGLPALVAEFDTDDPRAAPVVVLRVDLDPDAPGKIRAIHLLSAPDKLRWLASANSP